MASCPDDISSSFMPSPCLICGGEIVGVKTEVDDDDEGRFAKKDADIHLGQLRDAEELHTSELLQFFFKLFRVKPEEELSFWRCENGDKMSSPFCHLCKHRLEMLAELQKKLGELEEQLKNGMEELKEAMESSEEGLQKLGIYKRDQIYYRIRRQVLRVTNEQKAKSIVDPWEQLVEDCDSGRRTSSRSAAKKARGKLSSSALATAGEPRVVLSAADRECADGRNKQTTVKNKNESALKIEELENSEWDLPHSDQDEVIMDHSVMSSDPDYEVIPEKPRRKKMKTKRRKADLPKTINNINQIASNDNKSKPKRRRRTIKPTLSGESASNPDCILENDSIDSVFEADNVERRTRKPNPKLKDDEDFVPPEDDNNHSSSEAEEDIDSDFDYEDSKGRKRKYKRYQGYKYHFDEETGNYTVQDITLVKLPNNEFGKEQYKCTKCTKTFTIRSEHTQDEVRKHIWRSHSGRYKCKECGNELQTRSGLTHHIESIHQRRIFPCPICEKPFAYLAGMKRHKVSHLNEEEKRQLKVNEMKEKVVTFQCEDCGFPAKTIYDLRSHRIRIHGTEEEKAKMKKLTLCPECGKYISCLQVHMEAVHGTERKYPCVLCDKRFKTLASLKLHRNSLVHNKELPFKCTVCTKTYPSRHQLKTHMQIHLNIRKFKCEHCPSAFTRKSHLQNHCSIYHDEGSNPKRPTFVRGPVKKGLGAPNPQS